MIYQDFEKRIIENSRKIDPTKENKIMVNFDQFNRDDFKNKIVNIDSMDDTSLCNLIKNNIDIVSTDILNGNINYINLFRNPKFINAFCKVLTNIPVDYSTQLACNRITYDYFTSENPDPVIKQNYLELSNVINRTAINRLKSLGLDANTASNLALCRYSSSSERINVKRVNFAIYNKDPAIMTDQMIVWIYEKLFTSISDLFKGTIFEVYTPQQQEDFGDNFMEIYASVGLAVLIILNNMTSENIRKFLLGYSEEWITKGKPCVRYSLRSLSEDFARINRIVEYLNDQGIYIP